MFIRAYLRASTDEQDATRAKNQLDDFIHQHNKQIACYYVENESGATLDRPELFRLLSDAQPGDLLLVEQVDRLARLNEQDWLKLRSMIDSKDLCIVALDLPTSHSVLTINDSQTDTFSNRMLSAINSMLLDMLAAIARKDYDDRRRRQAQGIENAKSNGVYHGKPVNQQLHNNITELLVEGKSIRKVASLLNCSTSTVQKVKKQKGI